MMTRHVHASSESQVMAVESILVWDKKSSPAYKTNGTELVLYLFTGFGSLTVELLTTVLALNNYLLLLLL